MQGLMQKGGLSPVIDCTIAKIRKEVLIKISSFCTNLWALLAMKNGGSFQTCGFVS